MIYSRPCNVHAHTQKHTHTPVTKYWTVKILCASSASQKMQIKPINLNALIHTTAFNKLKKKKKKLKKNTLILSSP